jgi:hypothetical protein
VACNGMKSVRPNADEKHAWILPLQRLQWKKPVPASRVSRF